MMPVILWSDALVFLLLAAVAAATWQVRRRPHLLLPWQRVRQNRLAMVAASWLALFLLVGGLDTLHFRPALPGNGPTVYAPEVVSVLDTALGPLKRQTEKTYSAPFATQLYAKESLTDANGQVRRDFPRLRYGGAHLGAQVADADGDIARRGALGALAGWLALGLLAAWQRWRGQKLSWVFWLNGGVMAALLGATASLAPYYHVLGTDKVGQDVLYLALKSIRTGLIIGTVTTLVTLPLGLGLGIAAGYFRGWVDDVIQYIYTVLSSIPSVLLIAAAVLMMQTLLETHPDWFDTAAARADVRLVFLCLILGVTSWTGLCRLLRGETLKLREMEYIQAAQAFGVSSWRILSRHIVPNVMHIVLISLVMDFSALVLAEAVLSYVGVGVDPSMTSFGTLINAARLEMGREPMVWWTLAAAFSFMLVLVLAANLFADAVRDAFDPRLNRTT